MTQLVYLVAGAILGYCSGWLRSFVDERRKRRAVATALLVEQQRVAQTLLYLRDRWRGGKAVAAFPSTMHDRFAADVALFDATTVARVLEFSGLIAEVRRGIEHVANSTNDEEKKRHVGDVKSLCDDALARAGQESESLTGAGAVLAAEEPRRSLPGGGDDDDA